MGTGVAMQMKALGRGAQLARLRGPLDLAVLDRELRGQVVTPGERDWDEARAAWNLAADQRPLGAVFAEGADDIAAALSFARDNDLHVAPQGTGHGARAGIADGALLLRTERMNGIEIDAGSRRARVEAGTITRELGDQAAQVGTRSARAYVPRFSSLGSRHGVGTAADQHACALWQCSSRTRILCSCVFCVFVSVAAVLCSSNGSLLRL
jgi:hypothetical protein